MTNVKVHVPTTNVDVHVTINTLVSNVEDLSKKEHGCNIFDNGDILNDTEENNRTISVLDLEKIN